MAESFVQSGFTFAPEGRAYQVSKDGRALGRVNTSGENFTVDVSVTYRTRNGRVLRKYFGGNPDLRKPGSVTRALVKAAEFLLSNAK